MATWSEVVTGLVAADETLNFGERKVALVADSVFETRTLATIGKSSAIPVDSEPQCESIRLENSLTVCLDATFLLFDDTCSDLIVNHSFDDVIDCFQISKDQRFAFFTLKNRIICLDLESNEKSLYDERISMLSDNDEITQILLQTVDDKFQVYLFINNGQILCADEFPGNLKFVEVIAPFSKHPVYKVSNDGKLSIFCSESTITFRSNDLKNQKFETVDLYDFKIKKIESNKTLIALLSEEGVFQIMCAHTFMVIKELEDLKVSDFAFFSSTEQKIILVSNSTIIVMSLIDFKIKFQMELKSQSCYLVRGLTYGEDLLYLEGLSSDFQIKSISLNEPILRLESLLRKRRFIEAEEFAQNYDLMDEYRKEKVRWIMSELHLRKKETCLQEFNELFSLIQIIEDNEFVGECCIKACVPDVTLTVKLLKYGWKRLSNLTSMNDDIKKKIKSLLELINKAETFIKIYKDGGNDEWLTFSTANPIVLCRKFLKSESIEVAIMICERNEAKIKSELSIEMAQTVFDELPSKVPIESTYRFLESFLPLVLSVHPHSLDTFVNLIIKKVLSQESLESRLNKSLKFLNDCSQLLLSIMKSKGAENISKSLFPELLNLEKDLKSLVALKDDYNIILSYNEFATKLKDPIEMIYELFDVISENFIEHFINNFVNETFPQAFKDHDNLIEGYIVERLLRGTHSDNENFVIPFLNCIKDETVKITTLINILKNISVPIDKKFQILIESLQNVNHPLVADLNDECNAIKKKTILKVKYGIDVENIDLNGKMDMIISKIFKEVSEQSGDIKGRLEEALDDAKSLWNGSNKNKPYISMMQNSISAGCGDIAFSILKRDLTDLEVYHQVLRSIQFSLSFKNCKNVNYYLEAAERIFGYCGTFNVHYAHEITKEAKCLLNKYKTSLDVTSNEISDASEVKNSSFYLKGMEVDSVITYKNRRKANESILGRYKTLLKSESLDIGTADKLAADAVELHIQDSGASLDLTKRCVSLKLQANAYSTPAFVHFEPKGLQMPSNMIQANKSTPLRRTVTPIIDQVLLRGRTNFETEEDKIEFNSEFETTLQSLPPSLTSVNFLIDHFWHLKILTNAFDDRTVKKIQKNVLERVSNVLLDMINTQKFDLNLALITLHFFSTENAVRWLHNVSKNSTNESRRSNSLSLLGKFYTELHSNLIPVETSLLYHKSSVITTWGLRLSNHQLIRPIESLSTLDDKKKLFKKLIAIPNIDMGMIIQYSNDMNLDVQKCLLSFLEHNLVTYTLEFEFQDKAVLKSDTTSLARKCQLIAQQITNREQLMNALFGSIWLKIPKYYYEIFLIILDLAPPENEENIIRVYHDILYFLCSYTRVGPIQDSEKLEWLNSNIASSNLEIAKYRLPFYKDKRFSISSLQCEFTLENYFIWINAPESIWANGSVDKDLICSKAISNLKTNNLLTSEWSMVKKQEKLLQEIQQCIDNINNFEIAVGSWYYVVNYIVQPGADQVQAAGDCLIKANLWAENEVSEKSNIGKTRARKKYLTVSTKHILYSNNLGKPEYLNLAHDPVALIHTLYHDPSILDESWSSKISINKAVERIGALHEMSILSEITFNLLPKWLEDEPEWDGSFSNIVSDNVKRACYLLQGCNELANIENDLIGIIFPRSEEESSKPIGVRMRALQCLLRITDQDKIQHITARPIDFIKSRLKNLETQYYLKLFNIGFSPLNFGTEPKDNIILQLLNVSSYQKVKFAAYLASSYRCSLDIWNEITLKMLDHAMKHELETYLRNIEENCKLNIIKQVWTYLIESSIQAGDHAEVIKFLKKCTNSLFLESDLLDRYLEKNNITETNLLEKTTF